MIDIILKSAPLGAFVLWLISFTMKGPLMPEEWHRYSPLFTLSSSVGYFTLPFLMKNQTWFRIITVFGSSFLIMLTPIVPSVTLPGWLVLSIIGFTSTTIMFRAVLVLITSKNPIISSALAIAGGNALTACIAQVSIHTSFKFFLISIPLIVTLLFPLSFKKEKPNRELYVYIPFITLFYLIGGIFYAYIMPLYLEQGFLQSYDLVFYISAVVIGAGLVMKCRSYVLPLALIFASLSFTLGLFQGKASIFGSMFAIQIAFGFADLMAVTLVLSAIATPWATGLVFGSITLAITIGELVTSSITDGLLGVAALGNLSLIGSLVVLYFIVRGSKAVEIPENKSKDESRHIYTMEWLNERLESLYKPNQKRLTEKEKAVLLLCLQGLKYKDIADRLGSSESTVKTYMSRIFTKLEVVNKSDLIEKVITQS